MHPRNQDQHTGYASGSKDQRTLSRFYFEAGSKPSRVQEPVSLFSQPDSELAESIAAIVPVFDRRAVCPDNGGVREAERKQEVLTVGVSVRPLPRTAREPGTASKDIGI